MSWFVLPIYLLEFQRNQSKSMPSGQPVTGLREPLIACRSKISTVCNLLDAGGFCTTDSSEMQNTLLIILAHFACQLMIHKVLFAIHPQSKVCIFWEGCKILQNLQLRFFLCSNGQIYYEDFAKFCDLLRIYELYQCISVISISCITIWVET